MCSGSGWGCATHRHGKLLVERVEHVHPPVGHKGTQGVNPKGECCQPRRAARRPEPQRPPPRAVAEIAQRGRVEVESHDGLDAAGITKRDQREHGQVQVAGGDDGDGQASLLHEEPFARTRVQD